MAKGLPLVTRPTLQTDRLQYYSVFETFRARSVAISRAN